MENALTDLMIIGSSHFNVLKSVILDNGDLVEARFILDDLIPPARRSEENYVGQYISTGSSNGKKYRLEMAIVKEYYSDVIDDILPEEGVEIEVITK